MPLRSATTVALVVAAALIAPALRALDASQYPSEVDTGSYLQNVTQNSISVRWFTTSVYAGAVEYTTHGGTSWTRLTESAAVSWHRVDITGLSTGAKYDYRVLNGSMQLISGLSGTFKTAPSSTTPFNFIVWGDNRSNPTAHQDVADEAATQAADVAVAVGDSLGSAYNSYSTEFYNPAGNFLKNVPFFACAGNHEYKAEGLPLPRMKAFLNQPTAAPPTQNAQQYFAFTYANCRFIMLDSNSPSSTSSTQIVWAGDASDGPEYNWLVNELASPACVNAKFRFVFLHHPVVSLTGMTYIANASGLRTLFANSHVDFVFQGHVHGYERFLKSGANGYVTHFITCGGGGAPLDNPEYELSSSAGAMQLNTWQYEFCQCAVDADTLKVRVLNHNGVLLDYVEVNRKTGTPIVPPVISGVSSTPTSTGATITWTTDVSSDSQADWGPTNSLTTYGSLTGGGSSVLNTALTTTHSVTLSGLQPNTYYYYRVKSREAGGNLATSTVFTFQTSASTATPPTVQTAASANPNPVTAKTTALTVLGGDAGGEATLTYTWAAAGTPPAAVSFSANGTNAAKNCTATFSAAGSYTLQVTIKNAAGLTVTSSVSVTVRQTATAMAVSPSSASVNVSGTQQFTATASDQFGKSMNPQPAFTWTVSGGGTISASGLFTAGSSPGGPYTITAKTGSISDTSTVVVLAPSLPTPWQQQDIGSVGVAGSASANGSTFTVNGGGADIYGSADAFHYVYQQISGDFTLTARVVSVAAGDPTGFAMGGVMARQDFTPGSPEAMTMATVSGRCKFRDRSSADGSTDSNGPGPGGVTIPQWVRVVRQGNSFSGFRSADGSTWTQVEGSSAVTIAMTDPVYIGLICCGASTTSAATATIDNVTLVRPASQSWADQDIGAVGIAGTLAISGGTYTIKASGTDIYGSADAFHYVYQSLSGDGSITARINSIAPTADFAQAGVMIRETLAANSDHATMLIAYSSTTGQCDRAKFRARTSAGGSTSSNGYGPGSGKSTPGWVRITRSGNTFTGYLSADGSTWETIGTATFAMGANAYIGFYALSANNSVLGQAVIDNVALTGSTASARSISAAAESQDTEIDLGVYSIKDHELLALNLGDPKQTRFALGKRTKLPTGVKLSAGRLLGAGRTPGSYAFSIQSKTRLGGTSTQQYRIKIAP